MIHVGFGVGYSLHLYTYSTCKLMHYMWCLFQSLDKRAEYRKSFAEAGIDGLHLLELSATEMTGK